MIVIVYMTSWYTYSEVFQASNTEIHFFSGRLGRPRSQLTIFRTDSIDPPLRVPNTSIAALAKRYRRKKFTIDKFDLPIKIILVSLLTQETRSNIPEFKEFVESFDEQYFLYFDELHSDGQSEKKVVISQDIKEPNLDATEFVLFHKIITNPSTSSRQNALSKLIMRDSKISWVLTYWLLDVRPEMTASVIRELGRKSIKDDYILELCRNYYLQSENTGINRFAFWYLYTIDPKSLQESDQLLTYKYAANQFKELPDTTVWRKIKNKYNDTPLENSNALLGLSQLSSISVPRMFDIVKLHYQKIKLDKNWGRIIRRALMPLLKQAEMTHDHNLVSVISLISLMGRSYTIHENSIEENIGPIGFEMKYVHQRIRAIFRNWNELKQPELIEQAFRSIIINYPPGRVIIGQLGDIDVILRSWVQRHPIFRNQDQDPMNTFRDDYHLRQILIHQGEYENELLTEFISNQLTINQNHLNFEDNPLNAFLVSRLEFIKTTQISVKPNLLMIDPQIIHRTDKFLSNLVDFCVSKRLRIEKIIISEFIARIFQDKKINTDLIILYAATQKDDTESANEFLQVLFDRIELYFSEEKRIERVEQLIINQIVSIRNTLKSIPEEYTYKLDALKILYKDDIPDFDLENWQPLDIETIATVYQYGHGEIPSFVEGTINYAFSKPDWDQLARHYMAMGLQRPKREAIAKSQLKRIPNQLTRDILGQIALVNQTLAYCERNGFSESLENLIIQNIYKRGWNIERRLERTIASLFGSISPRLRSYFAAYLVTEQGELNEDILELARDVENYLIRDRIVRSLERYATTQIWFTLAESYYQDIREQALRQIKETRMSPDERSKIIIELINASRQELRDLGRQWLSQFELMEDDMVALFYNPYLDCWEVILDYIETHQADYKEEYDTLIANLLSRILWHPDSKKVIRDKAVNLIGIINQQNIKNELKELLGNLSLVSISSRAGAAIEAYTNIEESS